MSATVLLSVIAVLIVVMAGTAIAYVVISLMRSRPHRHVAHEVIEPHRLGATELGRSATLLQFSTDTSARCPDAHRTLASVAAAHEGVRHLDIDLTDRPDIAKHFHVRQTPTTLVLDRDGAVQTRFGGMPSRHVVELELARLGVSEGFVPHDPARR